MARGGKIARDYDLEDIVYGDPRMIRIVRGSGLLLSLLFAAVMLYLQAIGSPTVLLPSWLVYALAAFFALIGIVEILDNPYTPAKASFYNLAYAISGFLLCTFVIGYKNGLVYLGWLTLIIMSNVFLSVRRSYIVYGIMLLGLVTWLLIDPLHESSAEKILAISSGISVGAIVVFTAFIWGITKYNVAKLRTSREQATVGRERLLALINSMGDSVISTNQHGVIMTYNAATLSLLDTNATLTGRRIDSYLKLTDEKGVEADILAYAKQTDHIFSRRDLLHEYADGEKINLYINVSPVRRGYQQKDVQNGYIFIIRDITKEKSLEQERDEFISVVSHELRTPIAIMEGNLSNVEFILHKSEKTDPKLLSQAIQTSHEQVVYLANMVNDLSTLSRAERGVSDSKERVDIKEMISNVYAEYLPQAETKKLHLNLDADASLGEATTSRLYLEEILQNFVTNAIKYTQKGDVTIHAHKKPEGIEFAISDSGIGISKSDQKRVFEKFYRSEDFRTRETSGTGLGLYVTHKLAAKLGVTITLTSHLNHGSTFSFVLPMK